MHIYKNKYIKSGNHHKSIENECAMIVALLCVTENGTTFRRIPTTENLNGSSVTELRNRTTLSSHNDPFVGKK